MNTIKSFYMRAQYICAALGIAFLGMNNAFSYTFAPKLALEAGATMTGVRESASSNNEANALSSEHKIGFGLGGLLEAPLSSSVGIEIGAFYMERKYGLENSNLRLVRTVPVVFMPVEARFWLFDIFSVAGGGFVAFLAGDEKNEISYGSTRLGSFSSGDREGTELGLTVAAAIEAFKIKDSASFFIEGRYNYGLTNASRSGTFEEHIDDLNLMAGVRFNLSGGTAKAATVQ